MSLRIEHRLRLALVVAALSIGIPAVLPGYVLRFLCLVIGLLALGYAWSLCSPQDEQGGAPLPESATQDVLAGAGHDLRQPVQAISLFAASLAAYPLPEHCRKMVAGIESGVQSLSGMLESVCGIAKLRTGRLVCNLQPLALEGVFAGLVEDKLDIAHERHLHLRHARTRRLVKADPVLLQQALTSLLACAFDQTSEGGILLGSRKHGGEVWIEVRNTGTKVPELSHVKQFLPGEGYCNSLPDKGYGLAYAQGLAQLMGGALEALAWPQRGSLLRLRLQAA